MGSLADLIDECVTGFVSVDELRELVDDTDTDRYIDDYELERMCDDRGYTLVYGDISDLIYDNARDYGFHSDDDCERDCVLADEIDGLYFRQRYMISVDELSEEFFQEMKRVLMKHYDRY